MYGYLERRLAGQLAGLLFVGSGALSAVTLLLPQPSGLDRLAVLATAGIAVFIGGIVFVFPWPRVHPRASMILVPVGFALIALGSYYGNTPSYTYALFFVVVFVWIGLAQPRWTSTWTMPVATVGYSWPLLSQPDGFSVGLTSAALAIPVCVLVGESIAWAGEGKERSRQRTLALAHVAQALGPHLNVDAVGRSLVNEVRVALNTQIATFVRIEPTERTIQGVYSAGLSARLREAFKTLKGNTLDDNPGVDALARGEPEVVEDARRGAPLLPDAERYGIRSYLAIPVLVGDELAGILSCGEPTPRRYTGDDIVLARALANQASAALRNATLYEQTHRAALRDPLTGVGNRRAFHERLGSEITRAQRYHRPVSLIVLDVDRLKPVNDTHGHLAGDRALERLARLLERNARREDGVFRVGGDEFALVLPETPTRGAAVVGERIRRALRRVSVPLDEGVALTTSVGVASFPEHGLSLEELFERADAALYEVKFSGGDAVAVATQRSSTDPGMHLGLDIPALIRDRRLVPLYQPIVHLASGSVMGYEAFCRLDDRASATPTPTLFKAASASGLSDQLDEHCRDVVLQGAAGLATEDLLFLNISPEAIASEAFDLAEVVGAVTRTALEPAQIVLELTEQQRDRWSPTTVRNLEACRAAGFGLALDGFGAAERDVELLAAICFDHVKVDLGFVHGLHDQTTRERALREILVSARGPGRSLIAEGIERLDDLELARTLQFDAAQGFFIKDPGPSFDGPRHLDLLRSS